MPQPPRSLPERVTVIFDGSCGFCTWSVRLLHALDHCGRVTTAPCQATDLAARVPVTREQCAHSAWAVTADGTAYPGAEAVVVTIATLRQWPWVVRFGWLPGVHGVLDLAYAAFSHVRHRLPGDRPYCEAHPDTCLPA